MGVKIYSFGIHKTGFVFKERKWRRPMGIGDFRGRDGEYQLNISAPNEKTVTNILMLNSPDFFIIYFIR